MKNKNIFIPVGRTKNSYKYLLSLLLDFYSTLKRSLGLKKCFFPPLTDGNLHEDNSDSEF